ncbi:hypothetical protein TcG_11243 [Trypanosoma cruzi]|uniref:Nucleoporin n=1 Tax=Trypanosoma cruzi TaxID=5693 RepID=A0A2V2V9D5_TRYCR|nr:hypothetical protein BCY84_05983 [Trypanosoma cruzi cruzi]PWU92202.1 hypothetical protein C4B63_39g311 [Trypanosoma cruzi]RNF02465.1 hypothetical protein TcG_11243 [Trypanosoma cruzi]
MMLQSLLHYSEQNNVDDDGDFPPLLRSVIRPASHCPLFDLKIEEEHTWPCANLLNGNARYRVQYQNGAHLVMSDNRLLVVCNSEHFYCPPWNTPIRDACVQQQGADGNSILAVGLADGLYLALLQRNPQLQVTDDVFLTMKQSVEKIVFLRDGEMALCYGNAQVEIYRINTENLQKVSLVSINRNHTLNFFQAVASLWDTRRYRDSAYDSGNGRMFVLSDIDLTVWAYKSTDAFAAVCSVRIQGNVVAVLPSSQLHRYAMLVFNDGGRQPVIVEETFAKRSDETRTVIRLGAVRPLPEDVLLDTVELACQDADGNKILYDSRKCTLVMLTVASPIYEDIFDVVEVVSLLRLSTTAVGVACVSELQDLSASFIVYGKGGILCRIGVRSLGYMFYGLLQKQGLTNVIRASLHRLGPKRGIEALVGAAFAGASKEVLSPLLQEFMQPSFCENEMRVAPGVNGIISLVNREITLAECLWNAPFSWHLIPDLERIALQLWAWHEKLEALLRPYGWLDCPKQLNLSWNGFVATSHDHFTIRTALNTQAMLLETLLKGLRDAGVLCWLYSLLLRGKPGIDTMRQNRLKPIVWGDDPSTTIASLCMETLLTADGFVMSQLEARKNVLPIRARHAISIHLCISGNQPDAALAYACDNVRSLRHEQVFGYVAEKLEGTFPERMPHLRLLLCWLRYNRGAIVELLEMLERYRISESSEQLKLRLGVVLQAVTEYPALQHAVVRWMVNYPLEDDRVMGFAELLEEHSVVIDEPQTLTALFFVSWANRNRRPALAARGFCDIARGRRRLALPSRILCIKLALEFGPTASEQLVYFVLLLQEELAEAIEAAWRADAAQSDSWREGKVEADVDELRHSYLDERRLFQLAGEYKEQGGAKVQLDLLKVHPETPEKVTVEVLHELLEFLIRKGMSATEAARNVVREYYDGYAAGLPLLPFVALLAQHGVSAEEIATLLQSSGVPTYAVVEFFFHFLDERSEGLTFKKGSLVTTLVAMVAQLSGESRDICAAYLLERIQNLLEDEQKAMAATITTNKILQESDIMQLQRAESLLKRPRTVSPP